MKLFSIFGTNKLEPAWSFSTDGVLWRTLFSQNGRIVGEWRNQERKQASFFCLNEESGLPLWRDLRLDEAWWVGMEAIHGRFLILHEFAQPDMPEHRGVHVVDLNSGAILWRSTELTFLFAYQDRLYAYESRFEKRIAHVLNLKQGEILETYEDGWEALSPVRQLAAAEDHDPEMLFPEIVDDLSTSERVLATIKKEIKGEEVVGSVEFIDHRDLLVFNYHKAQKGMPPEARALENLLVVIDSGKRTKLYHDVISTGASAPTPDSFFVKNESLYFVKNQNTLVSLRLWKS